ncbi:uncharacterized protein BXZ73DRAFT_99091 [Epithele typhae]|uniref:uncharacterized protein n=1 Tax=Epithele typhae TaxID=378194 RepID=UPI0020080324|nr:uncharacterized protein BXZ73DRAFT_99091 [Epithele typhae]KAH9940090.1 hypothetical protein BXZ73DRAFT_99091 [Epithele typhae]
MQAGLPPCAQRDSIQQRMSKIKNLKKSLADEERQLRSSWNFTLPINHLPRELLVDIFAKVIQSWTDAGVDRGTPGRRSGLMRVCRDWHDLILSEATLWSRLYVPPSVPLSVLSLHLSRSKNAGLDVYLDMKYNKTFMYAGKDIARLLALQYRRIGALTIPSIDTLPPPAFEALFCGVSWPILTRLSINFLLATRERLSLSEIEPVLNLTSHRFPELRTLVLSGGVVPSIDPQLLRQLRSLTLHSPRLAEWPSSQKFLTDLSEATQLEELSICRRTSDHELLITQSENLATHAFLASALPRLRSLTINTDRPQDYGSLVMHTLNSSGLMTVQLFLTGWTRHPPAPGQQKRRSFVNALFPSHETSTTPLLSPTLRSAQVRIHETQLELRGYRYDSLEDEVLYLVVHGASARRRGIYPIADALEDVALLLRGLPLVEFRLVCTPYDRTAVQSWRAVLSALPDLEVLDVQGSADVQAILSALRPSDSSTAEASMAASSGDGAQKVVLGTRLEFLFVGIDGVNKWGVDSAASARRLLEETVDCIRLREEQGAAPLSMLMLECQCQIADDDEEEELEEAVSQCRGRLFELIKFLDLSIVFRS